MRKSEVKSPISFIFRRGQIVLLLSLRHSIPLRRSILVYANVEDFSTNEEQEVVRADGDENRIAGPVHWLVLLAIDLVIISDGCGKSGNIRLTFVAMIELACTHML